MGNWFKPKPSPDAAMMVRRYVLKIFYEKGMEEAMMAIQDATYNLQVASRQTEGE